MIYTSYFANIKNLPEGFVPVSICGAAPEWWEGLQYKKVAPKKWFFQRWKQNHDNDFYVRNFKAEVLDRLEAAQVVSELKELSGSEDIILLCYETPKQFCHRHLVAAWLNENGFECKEWE